MIFTSRLVRNVLDRYTAMLQAPIPVSLQILCSSLDSLRITQMISALSETFDMLSHVPQSVKSSDNKQQCWCSY